MNDYNIIARNVMKDFDRISWLIAVWFSYFHITSNDCNDSSDNLLNVLSDYFFVNGHKYL